MRFLSLGLFLSLGGTDFLLAPRLTLFGPRLAEPLQQRGSNHQLIWPLFDALGGQIRFGKAYRAEAEQWDFNLGCQALGNLLSGGFSTYLLMGYHDSCSFQVLHILSLNACVPGPPMSYVRVLESARRALRLAWLAYADLAAERPRRREQQRAERRELLAAEARGPLSR
ncbi:hypothetical protein AK812_SmicGene28385 [Symbiodinium microadriaticum]|uniref:Uncharacterized protein n=1 Tax=Symbiodinium microadriaticum TaxID=2951 RepID=A0A1Q9D4K9_SYMMI|nr:hypothetical protein AK812_SmicGene28385 [Symbiodinium microadriaticum]